MNRSANIELARFIASLMILIFHVDACGANIINRVCLNGNYYVEFFFILTGYFTIKHFDGNTNENRIKNSIEYTIKKFIPIFQYTIVIVTVHWTFFGIMLVFNSEWSIKDFIYSFFTDYIFDVLLLSSAWRMPLVGSLWFVSSMMIVFPLFCFLAQLNNRYWIMTISFLAWLVVFAEGEGTFCGLLVHAYASMSLGAVLYEVLYTSYEIMCKFNRSVLTIIEVAFFMLPIVLVYKNLNTNKFVIFCFFVFLFILLSGLSYTSKIDGRLIKYLGRLSLPIYMVQLTVGEIIAAIFNKSSDLTKQILYYVGTFVIAIILMAIIDNAKVLKNMRNISFSLKD